MLFMLREIRIVLSDSKQHSDIKENIPIYAEKEMFDDNADVHGHTLCYEVKSKSTKDGRVHPWGHSILHLLLFLCDGENRMHGKSRNQQNGIITGFSGKTKPHARTDKKSKKPVFRLHCLWNKCGFMRHSCNDAIHHF